MDFSTMVLTMYLADRDTPEDDERVLGIAIELSLLAAQLGYNPWYTDHHFRGPWHSNPMQFAAYIAPQIPKDTYLGFGVLSTPLYHPVRIVESMNLLDQLTKGRTLYGLGSGFAGSEPTALGVDPAYHGSGQASRDQIEIMQQLWRYQTGEPTLSIDTPSYKGDVKRRIVPAAYRRTHPMVIRTAARNDAVITAAKNGWPAFLGVFGSESPLAEQTALYQRTLAEANHAQDVIDDCMRWTTVDWLNVVVADTDDEALVLAEKATAERLAIRDRYVAKYGQIEGPVVHRKEGQSTAAQFAAGGDMAGTIAGSPETVARHVQQLVDIGINHLLTRFLGEWAGETRYIAENSMRLFARDVMPRFRDVAPLHDPSALISTT